MKTKTLKLGILLFSFLCIASCSSDDDTPVNQPDPDAIDNPDQDIDVFIWQGMNAAYLYKDEVTDLANDRFSTVQELFKFLNDFSSPEATFEGFKTKRTVNINNEPARVDPFSFIVDDYIALEQVFSGVSKSNGMDYGLALYPNNPSNVFGFVRLVLPGTDAEAKGIKRGDIFNTINGTQITPQNFRDLLALENYTIGLASFDGNTVTDLGTSVSLAKVEYTENPIFIAKTLDYEGQKIGYLLYNDFVGDFDIQLNNAFGQFKNDAITDLVLDLRYNGGGLVRTAEDMASMITGQFNGQIFSKEIWNNDLQADISSGAEGEEALLNRFRDKIFDGTAINSLGLTKLYVLATSSTASASELVINGLEPYIEVIQIGGSTTGKYQASATLYDGDGFIRENANPNHTYAIQPLILKSANKNDVTDFVAGLAPDVPFREDLANLGVLGEVTEPFLKTALDFIVNGQVATARTKNSSVYELINWETKSLLPNYQKMYIDVDRHDLSKVLDRRFK